MFPWIATRRIELLRPKMLGSSWVFIISHFVCNMAGNFLVFDFQNLPRIWPLLTTVLVSFCQFWRLETLRSRYREIQCLVRTCFLVFRSQPSCSVLTWQRPEREKFCKLSHVSSYKHYLHVIKIEWSGDDFIHDQVRRLVDLFKSMTKLIKEQLGVLEINQRCTVWGVFILENW